MDHPPFPIQWKALIPRADEGMNEEKSEREINTLLGFLNNDGEEPGTDRRGQWSR
jgi:hypothetical protein